MTDNSDSWIAKALAGDSARSYAAQREAEMPAIVEGEKTRAAILYARFTELQAAGFTEDQALTLLIEGATL